MDNEDTKRILPILDPPKASNYLAFHASLEGFELELYLL